MSKKEESIDPVKLAAEIDKKAIDDKVAEYMGPPDDESEPLPDSNSAEQETAPEPPSTDQSDTLDDPATSKAVDEIVAQEGDEVLQAEDDKKLAEAFDGKKPGRKDKLKKFFNTWWHTPKYRNSSLIGLAVLLALLFTVPPTRYFLLNTAGVRASASVLVLDDSTAQPLKNVTVSIGKVSGQTDQDGKVKLTKLKLGTTNIEVVKRAFAPNTRKVTIGWGSNPFSEFKLAPTGSQYTFTLTDFLSDKPVFKAEATSGDASAVSDEAGKLVLTVDNADQDELKIVITAQDYRSEEVTLTADTKAEQALKLVPGRKQVFVSKRSGKFDLFKVDVDGKNEELLLAGTGKERESMTLALHPTDEVAAFVSSRAGERNKDGFLLEGLYLIDIKSATPTLVTTSERVQVVGWLGKRLIYVKEIEGTSGSNPQRNRLFSYDYETEDIDELAATNYFNDVLTADGVVYYAPSSAYQSAGAYGLFKINADGTGRQTVLNKDVWNVYHTDYDKLSIAVEGSEWYEHKLGTSSASKVTGPPSSLRSKLYLTNQEGSQSLWVEERDGKGVLLAYDVNAKTDKVIKSRSGLSTPVRWLSNRHAVFRVNSGQEQADYVINIDGGEPRKIKDVTNTGGTDNWYYY